MSFTSWLRNVRSALVPGQMARKYRRRRLHQAATQRPRLELLEDRCTPSTYSVTDLGTLDAADINNSGQVVGTTYSHAVLWQDGVATDLGTLGGTTSQAWGINASGQVVGDAWLSGNSAVRAFLITPVDSDNDGTPDTWYRDADQNGVNDLMRDLGTLGGSSSFASGINDSGQAVGWAFDARGVRHAFLWNSDGMIDLGVLPSDKDSTAAAINGGGSVVGYSWTSVPAFLWTPDQPQGTTGTMTSLGTLGTYSTASGINNAGQIVGYADTFGHAVLWQDGVATDLGTLPAFPDGSGASGINNAGQIVGSSFLNEEYSYYYEGQWYTDLSSSYHAALWQNGTVADLNSLVPTAWRGSLEFTQAINDAGQIVANRVGRSYLLTPNSGLNSFVVSDLPASATAGDTVTFTATALSDFGTTLTDYTGTVSFSSSDWQAEFSDQSYTFTPADQGVHTFTATLKTAGWQTLSVADTEYTGITGTQYIEVTAAAASQFTVAGFPSPRLVGAAGDFYVTATDAFGNWASSYTGTVHFTSTDSQATLPADYTFIPADYGTHTFSATLWTAGIQSITVTDLTSPSITGMQTVISVLPAITISDVTVTEGNTVTRVATFTATLSAVYVQPVTVTYATADGSAGAGSDYQAASGTLTFAPGETSKTVTVLVNGDRDGEFNESFSVNLSAPTNATIADSQGIGTILDDEPRISINDMTVTEGNTGTVNATFTVSLSVAYDVAVTVHYQTANGSATAGSDYAAASGDVTIAAGQTTKTFAVAVIGDRSAEPNEYFIVNLSAPTNAIIADGQGAGTIADDEPRISISDVSKSEGRKGKTTLFTFTVTLSAAYDQAVTMSYATANGTARTSDNDYVARTGTLTFAPGETTRTITIEVKGDSKKEADETFYLDLFGNSSNSLFTKNRGLGMILNDD